MACCKYTKVLSPRWRLLVTIVALLSVKVFLEILCIFAPMASPLDFWLFPARITNSSGIRSKGIADGDHLRIAPVRHELYKTSLYKLVLFIKPFFDRVVDISSQLKLMKSQIS